MFKRSRKSTQKMVDSLIPASGQIGLKTLTKKHESKKQEQTTCTFIKKKFIFTPANQNYSATITALLSLLSNRCHSIIVTDIKTQKKLGQMWDFTIPDWPKIIQNKTKMWNCVSILQLDHINVSKAGNAHWNVNLHQQNTTRLAFNFTRTKKCSAYTHNYTKTHSYTADRGIYEVICPTAWSHTNDMMNVCYFILNNLWPINSCSQSAAAGPHTHTDDPLTTHLELILLTTRQHLWNKSTPYFMLMLSETKKNRWNDTTLLYCCASKQLHTTL